MEQSSKQRFISVQQKQKQLQQQQQQESFGFIYARFMILHGKKLLVEGDTHIEAVGKGQKYFTNSTSYRKI